MKISAVSNSQINNANKNNPSFRGVSDGLVKFWQLIDNGGRAAQFTVEDMCGTNIPRSIKGITAGYKYTHKLNWAAFAQEAIREFLTGPTMCLTPLAIISLAKLTMGKTANTKIENIKNLSYIMSTLERKSSKETLDNDFIQAVASDMLKTTTGKEDISSDDIKTLTDKILEYKKVLDTSHLSKEEIERLGIIKPTRKEIKEQLGEVETVFESLVKKNKDSFENTSFLTAKYSISPAVTGATKTKNYADYAVNYVNDFKKCLKEDGSLFSSDTVSKFKTGWLGKRLALIVSMVGVTGFLMSFVPKLYTHFSGNVNPNAKAIYNEADKLSSSNGKEVKA